MPDVLLLAQGGNLLLTDGTDLLLVGEPPPQPGYHIEGRRLIRTET